MTKPRSLFITGAGGFIGSHLVSRLVDAGYAVTALLRREPSPVSGRPSLPESVTRITGDITRPESYASALAGHDALIHLAADYRVGVPATERAAMYRTNVTAAVELMEHAHAAGIPRLIHTSTTAALGETHGATPGEEHRHNGIFRCYYEETKHIAHELLRARMAAGMPVTMAILGGVIGSGDTSPLAFALRAFAAGELPFQVATTSRFQLCAVDAVCDAYLRLLEHPSASGAYIVAGESFSMPELFARMAARTGRALPKALPAALLRVPARIMDRLASCGVRTPLSSESLNVLDGSTYTYAATKAERELGWNRGDMDACLDAYLASLAGTTS